MSLPLRPYFVCKLKKSGALPAYYKPAKHRLCFDSLCQKQLLLSALEKTGQQEIT